MTMSSQTLTIVRGHGSVASGDDSVDDKPMAKPSYTAGPVGLAKCCRNFCCGVGENGDLVRHEKGQT